MKTQTLFVSVFALVILQACNETTGPKVNCNLPTVERGFMLVSVVDSLSGSTIANGVTVTAIHGKAFDSEIWPDLPSYASRPVPVAAREAGKYDLYVTKTFYKPLVIRNVLVKEDACGTLPTNVTARLQRMNVD